MKFQNQIRPLKPSIDIIVIQPIIDFTKIISLKKLSYHNTGGIKSFYSILSQIKFLRFEYCFFCNIDDIYGILYQ